MFITYVDNVNVIFSMKAPSWPEETEDCGRWKVVSVFHVNKRGIMREKKRYLIYFWRLC